MTKTRSLRLFYSIGFLRGLYLHLPIYTLFLIGEGVSLEMIVFAAMFYSVGQFVFEVPTGVLADKFGQRFSLTLSALMEAAGLVLIVLSPTGIGLCLSYALGGIAGACASGSDEALCYENAKYACVPQAEAYGKYMTNQTIGMVVANMVGGSLFALFGIGASSSLILGTAAMLFVAAALTPFLCEPQQPLAAVKVEGVKFFDAIQEGLEIIRGERLLTVMTIVSMLIIPGEWFLYNTYQPVFEQNAVSQTWFGLALSLGMLGNAAVTIGLGNIEKRFSLETILSVVTALCGLGFAFLAWTHSAWLAVVSVILILSLVEVYRPVVSDYVNERIPSHRRVTVLSTISFAQRVASTVLRILLAMAVVYAGARGAIAANAVYLVIGAGISWWLLTHCGCTHRVTRHPLPVLPDVHA